MRVRVLKAVHHFLSTAVQHPPHHSLSLTKISSTGGSYSCLYVCLHFSWEWNCSAVECYHHFHIWPLLRWLSVGHHYSHTIIKRCLLLCAGQVIEKVLIFLNFRHWGVQNNSFTILESTSRRGICISDWTDFQGKLTFYDAQCTHFVLPLQEIIKSNFNTCGGTQLSEMYFSSYQPSSGEK